MLGVRTLSGLTMQDLGDKDTKADTGSYLFTYFKVKLYLCSHGCPRVCYVDQVGLDKELLTL